MSNMVPMIGMTRGLTGIIASQAASSGHADGAAAGCESTRQFQWAN